MTFDRCMFLSFSLNIDSILRVCQMIKKLKFHLVYVFSFFMNLLLSISFLRKRFLSHVSTQHLVNRSSLLP